MDIEGRIREMASKAKEASWALAVAPTEKKNRALRSMIDRIDRQRDQLTRENQKDVEAAKRAGLPASLVDRLIVSGKTLDQICRGLEEVARLPDPVGEVVRMWKRPNGLLVGKMRIPLGVIGIIYESRPNVTVDAAALCVKSGNAVILRGGSEALHSNMAIAKILSEACSDAGLPPASVQLVDTTDRAAVLELLRLEEYIDLIIPRGGEGLIRFVVDHSKIPVIKHYKGVCHIYIDSDAPAEMAEKICLNAKTQRPGVCNAVETVLVHKDAAARLLPGLAAALTKRGVQIRGCPRTLAMVPEAVAASEEDWSTEYLDLVLSVRVVDDIDEAIAHIRRYGSDHTESIITSSYSHAQRFLREVQSSTVLVNASTRFSDGYEFGLGAEIGISTTKLHAYGPMGLEELTTTKFIVYGDGQIRE